MPKRFTPLVTNQIYHIYNRSIDGRPIFINKAIVKRAQYALRYYKIKDTSVRLSYFLNWSKDKKDKFLFDRNSRLNQYITLYAYCFMSNHFHLLLKQEEDKGISNYMSKFQNSITRFINTVSNRKGHIFQGQFKAVLIESNEQFLHVSRYIHLNPYSSYLVKNIEELKKYPWSSLYEYLNTKSELCDISDILSNFKNSEMYWRFIKDHSDYQKKLESIKHLLFE